MIQIGVQPLSAAFTEGPPSDPDQAAGGHAGQESRAPGAPSGTAAGRRSLFVSPPPCPFPRVFPGL